MAHNRGRFVEVNGVQIERSRAEREGILPPEARDQGAGNPGAVKARSADSARKPGGGGTRPDPVPKASVETKTDKPTEAQKD